MSDIKVNERDPYENYRTDPIDVNDSNALSDLKMSPLAGYDSGKELPAMKHIDSDELKDIADRTSRSIRGSSDSQIEAAREFIKQRGGEPGRRRFYSYSK